MFYEHMTAKFSGRAPNLAEPKVWSRIVLLPPKHFDAWMQVLDPHPAALEAVLRYFYCVGDESGRDREALTPFATNRRNPTFRTVFQQRFRYFLFAALLSQQFSKFL